MDRVFGRMKAIAKKIAVYFVLFVLFFLLYMVLVESFFKVENTQVSFEVVAQAPATYQAFYDPQSADVDFAEESSVKYEVKGIGEPEKIKLAIPLTDITKIRLDTGDVAGQTVKIGTVSIKTPIGSVVLTPQYMLDNLQTNGVDGVRVEGDFIAFDTTGNDPYILLANLPLQSATANTYYYIGSFVLALITTLVLYRFVYLRSIYNLATALFSDRRLIFSLAKNDFRTKFAGSYFGIIWAFVQPIMTILIFWFVFQVGFRSAPVKDVPFILWFICGLIPWFFFSDAWGTATNCFMEYGYLVKKVSFRVSILPMVKVLSSLFVHLIFMMFLVAIFVFSGFFPGIKAIQLLYFSGAMFVLAIALSFITSSLVIFFKDLSQIISIVLQFGMWLTPIMWPIDMVPPQFVWIFKLNPMYYIVMGYRDTMINNTWFFGNIKQTFYFWAVTGVLFLVGAVIFKKTRPHFADVL